MAWSGRGGGLRARVPRRGLPVPAVLAAALIAAGCAAESTRVDPVTRTFGFTARMFLDPLDPAAAPGEDPVSGRLTVTYDREADTAGGTLDAMSLTIAGFKFTPANTAFDYDATYDRLLVGGTLNGVGSVTHGTNDFLLSFRPATAAPGTSFAALLYTVPSDPRPRAYLADSRIPPSSIVLAAEVSSLALHFFPVTTCANPHLDVPGSCPSDPRGVPAPAATGHRSP